MILKESVPKKAKIEERDTGHIRKTKLSKIVEQTPEVQWILQKKSIIHRMNQREEMGHTVTPEAELS